jgi:hypothetical protein
MSESTETTQRRGFASPLQKAQAGKIGGRAGKIGGGKESPTQERQDVPTQYRQDVPPETEADITKKNKREETHFRQTVWMPKVLNRRLKVHAAKIETNVSGIINQLVEDYLKREEN